MAFEDLLELEIEPMVKSLQGLNIAIFGSNDTGKTQQASKAEKPLLAMFEPGGKAVKVMKKNIDDWTESVDFIDQLTNTENPNFEKIREKYQTIIIDPTDEWINYSEKFVCETYGVSDLGDVQQGGKNPNGYIRARTLFKNQFDKLISDELGYTNVFIFHEEIAQEPNGQDANGTLITKDFVIPKGTNKPKSSARMVRDRCDIVIYVKPNGIDVETGNAIMSTALCKQTQSEFARSRYITMPPVIDPFTWENLEAAILQAMEDDAKLQGMGIKSKLDAVQELPTEKIKSLCLPYCLALKSKFKPELTKVLDVLPVKLSDATDEHIEELKLVYGGLRSLAEEKRIVVNNG